MKCIKLKTAAVNHQSIVSHIRLWWKRCNEKKDLLFMVALH